MLLNNRLTILFITAMSVSVSASMAPDPQLLQQSPAPPPPPDSFMKQGLAGVLKYGGQLANGARGVFSEVVDENKDLIRQRLAARMIGRDYIPPPNPYVNLNGQGYGAIGPYGTHPLANPYGAQPLANPYGAQPLSNPYGAQPIASSYGAQPIYGTNPMISGRTYGSSPYSYDANPIMSPYSTSHHHNHHNGDIPVIRGYGNPPVNFYSSIAPASHDAGYSNYPPGFSSHTSYSPDESHCFEQSSNSPDCVGDMHPHNNSSFLGWDCNAAFSVQSSKALLLGAAVVAIGLAAF